MNQKKQFLASAVDSVSLHLKGRRPATSVLKESAVSALKSRRPQQLSTKDVHHSTFFQQSQSCIFLDKRKEIYIRIATNINGMICKPCSLSTSQPEQGTFRALFSLIYNDTKYHFHTQPHCVVVEQKAGGSQTPGGFNHVRRQFASTHL